MLRILLFLLLSTQALLAQKYKFEPVIVDGSEYMPYSRPRMKMDNKGNKYLLHEIKHSYTFQGQTITVPKYGMVLLRLNAQDSLMWMLNIMECDTNHLQGDTYFVSASIDTFGFIYINFVINDTIELTGNLIVNELPARYMLKIDSNSVVHKVVPMQSDSLIIGFEGKGFSDSNGNLTLCAGVNSRLGISNWSAHYQGVPFSGLRNEMYLLKYDSNFVLKSAKKIIHGHGDQGAYSVIEGENIYFFGENRNIYAPMYFDSTMVQYPINGGLYWYFVACMDTNGNYKWARNIRSYFSGSHLLMREMVVSKGRIYMLGDTQEGMNYPECRYYFQGSAGYIMQSVGYCQGDYLLSCYDTAGEYQWARFSSGYGEENSLGLAADTNGLVYIAGYLDYVTPFGADTLWSWGGADAYVVCLDSTGSYKWASRAGGASFEGGYGIGVDAHNTVYVMGIVASQSCLFGTDTVTPPYPITHFVCKMGIDTTTHVDTSTSVGLGLALASPRFTLYPNPSQGSCTLSLPQAMQGSYTLYDMAGRALQQHKLLPTQTDYTIHTASLSPGVYLLELSSSQGRQSQKLVVE